MYGGEKSASAKRAGLLTKNVTSHSLFLTSDKIAPGLGYSTGSSQRAREIQCRPSHFTSVGVLHRQCRTAQADADPELSTLDEVRNAWVGGLLGVDR
jgi:hypothetical protein